MRISEVLELTYSGDEEAASDRLKLSGSNPVIIVEHISIDSPLAVIDWICSVSGGVVVGGEKRELTEKEKGTVREVTFIPEMVYAIEAGDYPRQDPLRAGPERAVQVSGARICRV